MLHGVTVTDEIIDVIYPDGSRGVLKISSAPVHSNKDPGAPAIGAVAITLDVSHDRAQAEERLQVCVSGTGRGKDGVCAISDNCVLAQTLT